MSTTKLKAVPDLERQAAMPYIEQPIYRQSLVQPSPLAAAMAARLGEAIRPVMGMAHVGDKQIKVRWLKPEMNHGTE